MNKKKIIIPTSWYKLFRSKLQINKESFKVDSSVFKDETAEYVLTFPNNVSMKSMVNAQDYFYDSFKIKGDFTINCNGAHYYFNIHPLTQADNHYPWTSAKFDYLDTKKLSIHNANTLWVDISPIPYIIGKVPSFSSLNLEEINLDVKYLTAKFVKLENLKKVTIKLPDQLDKDNIHNFHYCSFKNCKNLKEIDFTQVGKNNFIELHIDKQTNQDVILKFKKDQSFPPYTLAALLGMNNGFTKAYLNEYPVYKLMDIKKPDDIIEVKYSDLVKKVQKKYKKIVDEVWEADLKKPSGPVR